MTRKKPVRIADAYPELSERSGAGAANTAERMTSLGLPEYMHARLAYLRSTSKKPLKALVLEALELAYPGDPQDPSLPLHRGGTPTPAQTPTTSGAETAPGGGESDAPAYVDVPLH